MKRMQKLSRLAMVIGFLVACTQAQTAAMIQGVVVRNEPDGGRAFVPGAKILLAGPAYIAAESDAEGKFAIKGVPPGSYEITAEAPGMTAEQNLDVIAGTVLQVRLWMKVEAVHESITVSGNATEPELCERLQLRIAEKRSDDTTSGKDTKAVP